MLDSRGQGLRVRGCGFAFLPGGEPVEAPIFSGALYERPQAYAVRAQEVVAVASCYAAHCQQEMKKAVDAGYWNMFRYNPTLEHNKLSVDSKDPTGDYQAFISNEVLAR